METKDNITIKEEKIMKKLAKINNNNIYPEKDLIISVRRLILKWAIKNKKIFFGPEVLFYLNNKHDYTKSTFSKQKIEPLCLFSTYPKKDCIDLVTHIYDKLKLYLYSSESFFNTYNIKLEFIVLAYIYRINVKDEVNLKKNIIKHKNTDLNLLSPEGIIAEYYKKITNLPVYYQNIEKYIEYINIGSKLVLDKVKFENRKRKINNIETNNKWTELIKTGKFVSVGKQAIELLFNNFPLVNIKFGVYGVFTSLGNDEIKNILKTKKILFSFFYKGTYLWDEGVFKLNIKGNNHYYIICLKNHSLPHWKYLKNGKNLNIGSFELICFFLYSLKIFEYMKDIDSSNYANIALYHLRRDRNIYFIYCNYALDITNKFVIKSVKKKESRNVFLLYSYFCKWKMTQKPIFKLFNTNFYNKKIDNPGFLWIKEKKERKMNNLRPSWNFRLKSN